MDNSRLYSYTKDGKTSYYRRLLLVDQTARPAGTLKRLIQTTGYSPEFEVYQNIENGSVYVCYADDFTTRLTPVED